MSIEANTFERITIENINSKTKEIAEAFGSYLLSTWGILSLEINVDGKRYQTNEYSIANNTELSDLCIHFGEANSIAVSMRSCNGGGVAWRMDSCFMKFFTDDPEVKANITYRSTDYYDTDPGVDMYLYDENGLQQIQYTEHADSVADIKEWFCYTPTLRICDEEQKDNAELLEKIQDLLASMSDLLGIDEDAIEIDWEDYGEIILNNSVRFSGKDISAIVDLANQLAVLLQTAKIEEFEFEIYAVPDGEGDYDFASVAIELNENTVTDSYCRF